MMESFSINAFSPILLAKAIEEFIPKDFEFNFASISAELVALEIIKLEDGIHIELRNLRKISFLNL